MPPTRMAAFGKTSRHTAMTSRVLSHQYVMIEEIQISSGSGKAITSNGDFLASRARLLIASSLSLQFALCCTETEFDFFVLRRLKTASPRRFALLGGA